MPGSHTSTSADHTCPEPAAAPVGLELVSSTERGLSGLLAEAGRYTGELQDAATGLYKIGARYLDTTLGRWTQQDPLLRAVNPLQIAEANPYAYVGCNPTNYTDPSGSR